MTLMRSLAPLLGEKPNPSTVQEEEMGGGAPAGWQRLLLPSLYMVWKAAVTQTMALGHPCNANCESVPQAPQQQTQLTAGPLLGSVLCIRVDLGINVLHANILQHRSQ